MVSPRPGAAPLFFCWLSTPSGPTNQTLPLGDLELLPKVSSVLSVVRQVEAEIWEPGGS